MYCVFMHWVYDRNERYSCLVVCCLLCLPSEITFTQYVGLATPWFLIASLVIVVEFRCLALTSLRQLQGVVFISL